MWVEGGGQKGAGRGKQGQSVKTGAGACVRCRRVTHTAATPPLHGAPAQPVGGKGWAGWRGWGRQQEEGGGEGLEAQPDANMQSMGPTARARALAPFVMHRNHRHLAWCCPPPHPPAPEHDVRQQRVLRLCRERPLAHLRHMAQRGMAQGWGGGGNRYRRRGKGRVHEVGWVLLLLRLCTVQSAVHQPVRPVGQGAAQGPEGTSGQWQHCT